MMSLVCSDYYLSTISEKVIGEKAKKEHSLCTVNVIVMNNFGSQQALMVTLTANDAVPESQSLHLYDGGLMEYVNVTFRLHLDAASMLTPW